MVKKLLLSFSVMAVLSSCFKELETPIYPEYGKEFESVESYVSFEQAISNADFVYKNIDGNHRRKIQDVGLLTRSADRAFTISIQRMMSLWLMSLTIRVIKVMQYWLQLKNYLQYLF